MFQGPGEFLQWTEHDKKLVEIVAASSASSTEATQHMVALEGMPFSELRTGVISLNRYSCMEVAKTSISFIAG